MKEQLISFETAKLAKEKGFDERNYAWYSRKKTLNLRKHPDSDQYLQFIKNGKALSISAPTQSLLQKWLRERHKIHVEVWNWESRPNYYENNYSPVVNYNLMGCVDDKLKPNNLCKTYEEALEEGLYQALKLIE